MSLSSKIKKRSALLVEVARRFPAAEVVRAARRPDAPVVFWAHHRHPVSWAGYVASEDTILKDVAMMSALADAGVEYRIVTGTAIGQVSNSTIVYSIDAYNPARLVDYSAGLMTTLRQLEAQGNTLYPSADEAELWENKVFMHRRFDELDINTPATVAVGRDTDLDEALQALAVPGESDPFPLLVKEPHSNSSQGLHKVASRADLDRLRAELESAGQSELLVQRLLDMRRDLRCTVIGGEIVHHYWRINLGEEWMPTTTRRGSQVDFVTFPEQWRSTITDAIGRLGLRSGAFDICWEHDDLDGPPFFLEVSPAYTPNPAPTPQFADRPYMDFKTQLTGPGNYTAAFADLVFDLQRRVVAAWGLGRPPS